MRFLGYFGLIALLVFLIYPYSPLAKGMDVASTITPEKPENLPHLTLGGGCFWCLESEFRSLEGVVYTRVGYAGGDVDHPSYREVSGSKTGHAEAVQVYYDPDKITARELLDYFLLKAHDPTQLNHQGVDQGPQYRSVIFYRTAEEKQLAQEAIDAANASKKWKDPIVTTLEPLGTFWDAEEYHQQYYEKYEAETGKPHIRVLIKKQKKALSE